MVDVAQLVEHQIVALVAVGSNPTIHPIKVFCFTPILVYTSNNVGAWRNW